MKIISTSSILLLVAVFVIACDRTPSSTSSTNTATVPAGRWEVYFTYNPTQDITTTDSGWKIVRLNTMVENKTFNYSSPRIKTTDATLFTDITHTYPISTFKTTGSTSIPTNEIAFNALLPPGYRMAGEYNSDAVVSYYFQARIPTGTKPGLVRIPGYQNDVTMVDAASFAFPVANGTDAAITSTMQTIFPGKVYLNLEQFQRGLAWPPVHDRITGTATLISVEDGNDVTVELAFVPIGNNGIVGAQVVNGQECKGKATVEPGKHMTATICAIIPRDAQNIRLVFYKEINATYNIIIK